MAETGPMNALTDITGLLVGHYTASKHVSGVTVVLCPQGAIAGVDVRGAAPGTRETDLLNPVNLVDRVHGIALCGGSVYGLAAADGVVRHLAGLPVGFDLGGGQVAPIVPAAVLYDLGQGPSFVPPIDASWGRRACKAASAGPVDMGSVGAGTGARSDAIKGGVGTASRLLPDGAVVAALVCVNSHGTVVDPKRGMPWEIRLEVADEFGVLARRRVRLPASANSSPVTNTTIGVVATDARLDKAQATKVAQMAHDGLARAIRPCHTMFDGDTLFCLSTGRRELAPLDGTFPVACAQAVSRIGHAAADCAARAVIRAIFSATGLAGVPAFGELPDLRRHS